MVASGSTAPQGGRGARLLFAAVAVVMMTCAVADALTFYTPGVDTKAYAEGETVPIKVNAIRSLQTVFPLDYYSLPFCKPKKIVYDSEIIGQTIYGEVLQNSMYSLNMKEDVACMVIPNCSRDEMGNNVRKNVDLLAKRINEGYRGYLSIDNLPGFATDYDPLVGQRCPHTTSFQFKYKMQRGYSLGLPKACDGNSTYVNNHLHFTVTYNNKTTRGVREENQYIVVGFVITPYSVSHGKLDAVCDSNFQLSEDLQPISTADISGGDYSTFEWTYSVEWKYDPNILWATRWDAYLKSSQADSNSAIHWLYTISGLVIAVMCASAVSVILLRAVRQDFTRYNSSEGEDLQEDFGWKLVHADVFRVPYYAEYLAIMVGTGFQLVTMVVFILLFACLGFLAPSKRGMLLTYSILIGIVNSLLGGYGCGVLLKYFGKRDWKYVFMCGCGYTSLVYFAYITTNIMNAVHHSTDTISFALMLVLILMWLLVSLPLTLIGASYAFNQEALTNPVRVGRLARDIPPQAPSNSPAVLYTVSPLFPLLTVILELQFILEALWGGQVYYVFGFLALVFILWVFITALVSVFNVYYMLCYENHQWWWSSFLIPGCLGAHLFVYTLYYYATQLTMVSAASTFVYIMYMALLSLGYGLAAGAVGFSATLMFVRAIFANIKVD